MTDTILIAASIITMDEANPRAEAIAFDSATGVITAVGTLADLVEPSMDPYLADPTKLAGQVSVQGTWLAGHRVDLAAYLEQVAAVDPAAHPVDHATVASSATCC